MKNINLIMVTAVLLFVAGCVSPERAQRPTVDKSVAGDISVTDISLPGRPRDVVCADFNHDGVIDIATVSKNARATLLIDQGSGQFKQSVYDTNPHNTSLAAADINSDGNMDFVALTEQMFGPIFLNDGKGNFTTHQTDIQTPPMATYIASADMNGDGLPDFVISSEQSLTVLIVYNRGNLHFEARELNVGGETESAFQEKAGGAEAGQAAAPAEGTTKKEMKTLPAELDKEKKNKAGSKMLSATPQSVPDDTKSKTPPRREHPRKYEQETGKRRLTLGASVNRIRHFALTDIDGDGRTDMVIPVGGLAKTVVIARNKGNEAFELSYIDPEAAEGPLSSVAVIRRLGAVVPDLAISQTMPTGKVFLLRNDGKGNFSSGGSFDTGKQMLLRMVADDLNADGRDDLLMAYAAPLPDSKQSPVQVWLQKEDGNFVLRDEFRSNGYAAHINVCRLSEKKAAVLSNIHEGTLSLKYLKY